MPKSFITLNKLKIGYYLYSITESDFYIHNLEISIKYRGKGYFKQLIENIKQTAKTNNCQTITLQPEYQNDLSNFDTTEKLKQLYNSYGFNQINELFFRLQL